MTKLRLDVIEQAKAIRNSMNTVTANLTDEQAVEVIDLYMPWVVGEAVAVGDMRRDEGKLYRCLQAHTTQADWKPALVPALWAVVSVEEWPEWVQPTGAHDAYALGAKVSHKDKHWVSEMDANVYEPGVYGWTEAAV